MPRYLLIVIVVLAGVGGPLFAQTPAPELKLDTGEQIFLAACNGCHGPGGKGQPETTLGFEPPKTFPDFTDCNGSTREKIFDWKATIHEGGRGRGFSEIMPSFAEALTLEQMDKVIRYLRSRCPEPAWPLGDFNFPRALMTEKAFPEDEVVVTTEVNAAGAGAVAGEMVYERRFGARNQLEFGVPYGFLHRENASWVGGVGDVILGFKRVMIQNKSTGSIFSLQGEVIAPTGNRLRDLGSGVTTFGVFGAFGQAMPHMSFFQIQTGADLPANREKAARAAFFRFNLGKTFAQNKGFGRAWTPMADIVTERELESGAKTNWDVVPQMQVTLNRRQHVRANVGFRVPVNDIAGRPKQLVFYLLWDWFDGGLREGW